MKFLSGILGLGFFVLILAFALLNRHDVSVTLWPVGGVVQTSIAVIGLAPLLLGLIAGGIWGWFKSVPHRRQARKLNKELVVLNEKINDLQKSAVIQCERPKPRRSFWRQPPCP